MVASSQLLRAGLFIEEVFFLVAKNFDELIKLYKPTKKIKVAVVNPIDLNSLEAIFHPKLKKIVQPILIGDSSQIIPKLNQINHHKVEFEMIDVANEVDAAKKAVLLAKNGEIDVLMKGHLQTSDFLRPVVSKETGIIKEKLLSHIVVNEIPTYHKLLVSADGGMVTEPSFEDKKEIIKHTLAVSRKIGNSQPKIALLAAAETVNPKIKSSVESEKLVTYFSEKYHRACYIDGPLSLDLAVSPEIVKLKDYHSDVAGEADILIGPDMTAMNILGKSLVVFAKGTMAGIIYGATVPIVMTSRASSSDEKYHSIVLASIVSAGGSEHE